MSLKASVKLLFTASTLAAEIFSVFVTILAAFFVILRVSSATEAVEFSETGWMDDAKFEDAILERLLIEEDVKSSLVMVYEIKSVSST